MKQYRVFLILFFCFVWASAQEKKDTSVSGVDGPYIFYYQDSVVAYNIFDNEIHKSTKIEFVNRKRENTKIRTTTCFISEKDSFDISIRGVHTTPKYQYTMPKKLIAISDIEGNFEQFKKFLINNKVIDKRYRWKFGKGHLVLNGDFFDRGLQVTQCLWLIYKLEQEAEAAGGKVHFILGNHDIMNLYGNTKYVRNKYLQNAKLIGRKYTDFYTQDTELGLWLQSKNITEVIGNYMFIHAGFSPELYDLGLSLQEINEIPRPHYFDVYKARDIKDKNLEILLSSKLSPYWYRGIARQELGEEKVEMILSKYNATKMVIGHTLSDEVAYLYGGKVINIDTDHAKGNTQGLFIKKNKEYKVDIYGKKSLIQKINPKVK